jgi:predicted regulator of Ras-like GTPase activity (Roadblock/LC7/MglB family)
VSRSDCTGLPVPARLPLVPGARRQPRIVAEKDLLMSSVFLSYSRKDRDAVAAMVSALRAAGEEVWVDLDEIVPSTVWMEEIKTAIANADSVIFVITPDSVASQVCGLELQDAVELSKRIVPVIIRDTPVQDVPAPLPDIDWAFV